MKLSKKILVAHQDAGLCRRLVMLFAATGFDVRRYDSPAAALEGARSEWFDLALVDERFSLNDRGDLTAGLRGIQPTLQILLMVGKLDLSEVVQGIRQGVAEVVAVSDDPMPVLRQALAFFNLEDADQAASELDSEELHQLESQLRSHDRPAPASAATADLEKTLLHLIAENRSVHAKVVRLAEEKSALEVELRAMVAQGADTQRVQGELETIRQERELAAATQAAIDQKARALSELRANLASERSALECERQRIAQETPPAVESRELDQTRAELAEWRRRLELEDDRVASDSVRIRQETLQLARERKRWHEDLELIRLQEANLRAYESRLRELQADLEAERVKWTGGAVTTHRVQDETSERALREAWAKLQRTGEILEAERKNFLDDRLHLREQEKEIRLREEKVRDREIRQAMREKELQTAQAPAPSPNARRNDSPVAALKNLTRGPFSAVRLAFQTKE